MTVVIVHSYEEQVSSLCCYFSSNCPLLSLGLHSKQRLILSFPDTESVCSQFDSVSTSCLSLFLCFIFISCVLCLLFFLCIKGVKERGEFDRQQHSLVEGRDTSVGNKGSSKESHAPSQESSAWRTYIWIYVSWEWRMRRAVSLNCFLLSITFLPLHVLLSSSYRARKECLDFPKREGNRI